MKTVSLELARQLKEAGYPQQMQEFGWLEEIDGENRKISKVKGDYTNLDFYYASPTADEILEQLPHEIKNMILKIIKLPSSNWDIQYLNMSMITTQFHFSGILADAAAKMWLYLKKEGLL